MLKSKLFIAAALLFGGILTANATDCYYQAEVHAVGHGKIYADGNQCMPDSVFLMGEDAYQTEMSALFHAQSVDGDSVEGFLYISTLPDAPEYEPVGVKFDSITDAMTYVWVDTCSWTTEEDVTYFTQRFSTNSSRAFTADTTHGTVYVIFKIKMELIQAACDSIDNYAASLTDEIDDDLRNIIENAKQSIRENDDDLDAMNGALDNAISAITSFISPTSIDTIAVVMDNAEYNTINTTAMSYEIVGADQNMEYTLSLLVESDEIAGTYTQDNVQNSILNHLTASDTLSIAIQSIADFTVVGDAEGCSTYLEILSTDNVLYQITYTYSNDSVAIDDVEAVKFVVTSEHNAVVIRAAIGQDVMISDLAGRIIMSGKISSDVERINVPVSGIYIARIGNRAAKVFVK